MFVPLHVKSDGSAGYGTASVEDLVRRAAESGWPAIALNDVENLYNQVRLHHAAKAYGIKALTGVELRRGFDRHALGEMKGRLVLLARDREGYQSLCRIVTRRRTTSAGDPLECLEERPRGVFFLSDDRDVTDALVRSGVHRDDIRFLLARGIEPPHGVRSVAAPDVVVLDPSDAPLHRLMVAIRTRTTVGEVRSDPGSLSIDGFAREHVEETVRVAEACTLDLANAKPIFPSLGIDAEAELERRVRAKAPSTPCLEKELRVLRELGFAPYFLIVHEIVERARAMGIPMAGRGSAASSLVAYVLGITTIDPIAHGLLFERFVHEKRHELPDIDLDFASDRRDEVIEWVFERFGRDRVAMVSAHDTFQRRSALREGLKAYGVKPSIVEKLLLRIPPDDPGASLGHLSPELERVVPIIERLVGKMQHVAVHPGGIVIADDLVRHAPLERAPKGVLVTQYDLRSVEKLGLVKIDLLGNRALSALEEIGPIEVKDGDPETAAALRAGDTVGCFMVESPATRSLLRRLPIRSIADLADALALVRPGPGDMKSAFVRRAHGEDVPAPLIYEEDIMLAIAAHTGCSLERADDIRSAIVRGSDPPGTGPFWDAVKKFAAYSFNKAHALSYAELAWRSAYARTHQLVPFACAALNHYGGGYPRRSLAADFVRSGVRILNPHVNHSSYACRVEHEAVRVGLGFVKFLARKNIEAILEGRPFENVDDLTARVPLSDREVQALVRSGACDAAPFVANDTYSALVRVRDELEFLEMHLYAHPIALVRDRARALGCVTTLELPSRERARIAGIVAATRRVQTKNDRPMQFITLEDEHGMVEAVLLPGPFAYLGDPITNPGPFLVEGDVANDHGDVHLRVSDVQTFPHARRGRP